MHINRIVENQDFPIILQVIFLFIKKKLKNEDY